MTRIVSRPLGVAALLLFLTAIPILMGLLRMVQIPIGATPPDVAHLMTRPALYWIHAAAGVSFGLLGPLQFGRALSGRFGRLHRIAGRAFAAAGALLAVGGIHLVLTFPGSSTMLLDALRLLGGTGLLVSLILAIRHVRAGRRAAHGAWMIRAYALGMGQSLTAFVLLPVYLATGTPPVGLTADLAVAVSWVLTILVAERLARLSLRSKLSPDPLRRRACRSWPAPDPCTKRG